MVLDYALFRRGPLAMAPSQLGLFTLRSVARARQHPFHVQPLSLDRFGEPLHEFPAFTASVCNVQPHKPRPGAAALRRSRRQADDQAELSFDRRGSPRRRRSIRVARRIVAQPALARYRPAEHLPGPSVGDDDAALVKAAATSTPSSTRRHRQDGPRQRSLGGRRRAAAGFGLERLRVVDASVMPSITSGNTNAPTMMIAEKGAAMIREDARDMIPKSGYRFSERSCLQQARAG